jgi:SAM-dependent methyltransferase
MRSSRKDWWETLFDDKYMSTYVDRVTEEDTRIQAGFITTILKVPSQAAILDLACGYGRLSIPLAMQGYKVTGFDFSRYLLDIAQRKAKAVGADVRFIQGDMRNLKFADQFDAVISIFTSFGYFKSLEEDLVVLRGIHRGLKQGGSFLLDFANSPRAIGHLYDKGEVDRRTGELVARKVETLSNGLTVTEVQRLNVGTLRWRMHRSWRENGKKRSYRTNVRMYFLAELWELIEKAGLKIERVYGDFDASPYGADSQRMLIVSRA